MSEQKKDAERAAFEFAANQKFYGGLAAVGDTWSEDRGMYVDPAHHLAWWAWQQRASLPVGAPDGESIRRAVVAAAIEVWGDGEGEWTEEDERFYPAFVRILLNQAAAPTVKAEQVECLYCQGHGDVTRISGQTAESYSEHNEECPECKGTGLSPSLPAAGSAVEELEVVAYRRFEAQDNEYADWVLYPRDVESSEQLMTVAQHSRIVAALSAQQSAPERVSVPVELAERIATHLEWDGEESLTVVQYANKCDALAGELRALLASHAEGGKA